MPLHPCRHASRFTLLLITLCVGNCWAADDNQQLDKVEIEGKTSDAAKRKASTAAKQVYGRDEIERIGGAKASELLKQLPGIETGQFGGLALRGLEGYTQILVDGKPPAPGVQALELPLAQIERIEVIRGASADLGGQGIGGTINLVLRTVKPAKLQNEVTAMAGIDTRGVAPSVTWIRHGSLSEDVGFTAIAGVGRFQWLGRNRSLDERDGLAPVSGEASNEGHVDSWDGRLRVQHRAVGGGNLNANVGLSAFRHRSQSVERLRSADPLPFDDADSHARRDGHLRDAQISWQRPWGQTGSVTVEAGVAGSEGHGTSDRVESTSGGLDTRLSTGDDHGRRSSWGLKWSDELGAQHQLNAGLEAHRNANFSLKQRWRNGLPDEELDAFNGEQVQRAQDWALYAQDDWTWSPRVSINLGWRVEQQHVAGSLGPLQAQNRWRQSLPSANVLWKLDEAARDQVRLGLSRTYKAPEAAELVQRPVINPFFACPVADACGANSPLFPDTISNPGLRPERAWGLDLAWERTLAQDGLFSVGIFHRDLQDRITPTLRLQDVDWASVPRWVNVTVNQGHAWSQGVELELKTRLDVLSPELPRWMLRSSASAYRSRDDSLPGPHNRLAGQSRGSAKLGLSHRLQAWPVDWSVDAGWQAGGLFRVSAYEWQDRRAAWNADASVGWQLADGFRLRLRGSNLLTQSRDEVTRVEPGVGSPALRRELSRIGERSWLLSLEAKF